MSQARFATLALLIGGCTDATAISPPAVAGGLEPSTTPASSADTPFLMGVAPPNAPKSPSGPGPLARVVGLQYYGGRVLTNVEIVQVLWGDGVPTNVATGVAAFFAGIEQSPYVDWLGEYDTINVPTDERIKMGLTVETKQKIGRGSFKGTVKIAPTITGAVLTDDQVFAELTHQIESGVLPLPADDGHNGYRTIYMIDFPAGIQVKDPSGFQTCQATCAYHSSAIYKGKSLAWGIHPDLTAASCTVCTFVANNPVGNATEVHSHELIEATTDPDIGVWIRQQPNPANPSLAALDAPVGWFAIATPPGGFGPHEIGDICNGKSTMFAGFTVQTEWSNNQGACITDVPGLPSCADGVGGACSPCTSSAQCAAPTPVCDTGTDLKAGECVACVDNTSCSGAKPVCDKTATPLDDTCRACANDSECSAPTPICATTTTATVQAGSCIQCLANTDCANPTPTCSPTGGTCMGCTADTDCTDPKAPSCDTKKGTCNARASGGCTVDANNPGVGGGFGLVGGVVFGLAMILRPRRRARS
jgi:hypothetical protein